MGPVAWWSASIVALVYRGSAENRTGVSYIGPFGGRAVQWRVRTRQPSGQTSNSLGSIGGTRELFRGCEVETRFPLRFVNQRRYCRCLTPGHPCPVIWCPNPYRGG